MFHTVISLCYTALNRLWKFWKVLHSPGPRIWETTFGHWDWPWRPATE